MKKILGVTLVLLLCLGMGGCTKQEAVEPTPTETGTVATTTQEKPEPTKNENLREYNKVLVDNDNLRAELLSIEYIYDDFWDQETIKVTFDVKNKQSFPIVVQARSVSINDRMVDTGDGVLVAMSQDVGPGKSAYAVLEIQNVGDGKLPKLEGNFEMTLHIFNWDDLDYQIDIPVSVPLD